MAAWNRPDCDGNEGKVRVVRNGEEDLDTTEKSEVDEKVAV